jgi:2-dehydro-3-deoxygluconokinase
VSSLQATKYDVVTIGETMLRLTPPGFLRLEQADAMQLHVGGSESNTAVGLARMGKRVAWLSRMTDNALGGHIVRTIASHGVDVQHVVWTDEDRVGLYFLESGSPPRTSHVIYDRAHSAYSKFASIDLSEQLFQPGISKWLHVTGISLWLGPTVRGLIARAVSLARSSGWQISFDVNHRALLCTASQAREHCESLFESADLAFLARRDAVGLWQLDPKCTDDSIMTQILRIRAGKPTVMTLGAKGAIAADNTKMFTHSVEPVEPIGRLGGGDAFSAGFLSAWLEEPNLERSLRWAVSTAMLKYSIPGDLPLIHRGEVERLVAGSTSDSIIR